MAFDSRKYYDAAKGMKQVLSRTFGATGVDFAPAPEKDGPGQDPSPGEAKHQYFANADTAIGRKNIEVDAGFSGSISSVILGSSAPNYDTGMGGSAGKEDEEKKKRQEEWDRLFWMQQELARRLQEIDWKIEEIDKQIHDTKEHMSALDREKAELEELRGIFDDHLSGKKPLKVGADGKLENEKAEKALQDYERRTGRKVDRNNPEELAAAVREIKAEERIRLQEIEEEYNRCQEELNRYGKEKEKWEIERTETKEHKDKIDKEFKAVDEAQKNTKVAFDIGDQKQVTKAEVAESEARQGTGTLNLDASETELKSDAPINLSTSAASRIDQDGASASMRGSFKTAHGALQTPDEAQSTELSRQDKAPAIKSPV